MTPANRAALSVTVITLNAESALAPCLESVRFAEEIVVLDAGSTDETTRIARRFGARVEHQPWLGFGPQKQRAAELASHDWILALDADERLSPELAASIERTLRDPNAARVYALPRRNRFMGRWLRHGEGYPDWCVRLFHRAHARWSEDPVHERLMTTEPIARLAGDLMHESAESIDAYLDKQNRYTTLAAETMVASGARVSAARMILSPLARFFRFYVLRAGFLDGVPGLVHIAIGCWTAFLKYAKAWALGRASR